MINSLLARFSFLLFCLPVFSHAETRTAVGEGAELIMKYGTISHTKCGNLDEMQWEFCTSMVKLTENVDEVKGYSGIWECSFHHNYAGHYVNIICLEVAREY